MRRKIIAGNWKMNLGRTEVLQIIRGLKESLSSIKDGKEVIIFPSSIHLDMVSDLLKGTKIQIGCQNIFPSHLDAFTGEISTDQLKEFFISTVLVGHSERRQFLKETSQVCYQKINFALENGFQVIYCVGETLNEREAGKTFEIIKNQIMVGLSGIQSSLFENLIIAYEPVWAIGTGKVATPEQAQEVHNYIRKLIGELFLGSENIQNTIPILYGGSVKPDNIQSLLKQPDIDGGLVGGASQKLDSFLKLLV